MARIRWNGVARTIPPSRNLCNRLQLLRFASKAAGLRRLRPALQVNWPASIRSLQFADGPLGALADGGVEIWCLLEIAQALGGVGITPLGELIDERDLHERRLLLQECVADTFANLWLTGVAAEGVEGGQADVDAAVVAQRVQQGRLNLRIEMRFEAAPAHALQAFAGGLLLQHGERDELAHVG